MKNFYFTFGQVHTDKNGVPLKDYWVRVVSSSRNTARILFLDWAKENLPRPEQWSFQYSEEAFNKEYFPKGELKVIDYNENKKLHTKKIR